MHILHIGFPDIEPEGSQAAMASPECSPCLHTHFFFQKQRIIELVQKMDLHIFPLKLFLLVFF